MSDTSPLRALALLNQLDLLDRLYEAVHVPPAVVRELAVVGPGVPVVDLARLRGVRATSPSRPAEVERLRAQALGAGEAEAIVVCREIGADGLLMDDLRAREFAARAGLRTIGVLGILLQARQAGLVDRLAPLIDRLICEMNFRVSAELRQKVLREAGEC